MKRKCWTRGASVVATVIFLAGCGGGRKEAAPAQTPASEPAYGAPAAQESAPKDEEQAGDRASGGAAAPSAPAGAALPGSMKSEGAGGEPMDEIDGLTRRLEGALSLSAPDCTSAWSLRDRICDLADRICDLASRSAERDVAERCSDGRARCQRATSRVRETCGR